MVGDPSGKDESRQLLTVEEIEANIASIKKRLCQGACASATARPTRSWSTMPNGCCKLNYIEFLRDVGRHFSVNRMLTLRFGASCGSSASSRCSFLEFNYMILPGLRLRRARAPLRLHLQMGGSDQWGNIVNGIDLGHRMGTHQLYALTSPLLTTSSGRQDGQVGARRGLAERRHVQPL